MKLSDWPRTWLTQATAYFDCCIIIAIICHTSTHGWLVLGFIFIDVVVAVVVLSTLRLVGHSLTTAQNLILQELADCLSKSIKSAIINCLR